MNIMLGFEEVEGIEYRMKVIENGVCAAIGFKAGLSIVEFVRIRQR